MFAQITSIAGWVLYHKFGVLKKISNRNVVEISCNPRGRQHIKEISIENATTYFFHVLFFFAHFFAGFFFCFFYVLFVDVHFSPYSFWNSLSQLVWRGSEGVQVETKINNSGFLQLCQFSSLEITISRSHSLYLRVFIFIKSWKIF